MSVKFTVPAAEIARVKGLGFLQNKGTADEFSGRIITRNGKITAAESRCMTEAAEKFGNGTLTFTARLTVEVQGIPYDKIEAFRAYLAREGLETGGTGAKVRPVVSCKGTTCKFGLIDTFGLSERIHEAFYKGYGTVKLPHKFKIAVGGCPNNCMKPELNDVGVIGQRIPAFVDEKCRGCAKCITDCPMRVLAMEGKVARRDAAGCNNCGRCIPACPFAAIEETTGYKVYIGGRWGKKIAQGRALAHIFTSEEEVMAVIEKAILLFREQGQTGERFADTIARIGFDKVQEELLGDAILARKEQILA